MSRDTIIENVRLFCEQDSPVVRYNEDTVNELELEVRNWNAGIDNLSPKDAPDCTARFKNAVIDGCDGNDMVNNPHNYELGATLRVVGTQIPAGDRYDPHEHVSQRYRNLKAVI